MSIRKWWFIVESEFFFMIKTAAGKERPKQPFHWSIGTGNRREG
jgi:hypothetical protein